MLDRRLFLRSVHLLWERIPEKSRGQFPFNVPALSDLNLEFRSPVTIFVGENGAGKSTLLEAIAELSGLRSIGGSKNELIDSFSRDGSHSLAKALRPAWNRRPKDSYFFRAEMQISFANLLEEREEDPYFVSSGDPYAAYGGKTLHERSHG